MAKLLRRRRQPGAEEGSAPSEGTAAAKADEGSSMLCSKEEAEDAMMGVEDQCCPSEPLWADEGTVCARIFRWALSRLLSPDLALERRAIGASARERLSPALLLLLARMVDAEKAVAAGGAAPAARQRRRETIERLGRKRRVSFSTFDLSTIDTPDISKRGSDQHMDDVLQSLYLALRAAEALREAIGAEGGSKANGKTERGKENEDHLSPLSTDEGETAGVKRRIPTRQALEKIVALLAELQESAVTLGGEGAPLTLAGPQGEGLGLLGEEPNWVEVSNAAALYARELRLLCITPAEEMQGSRLLGRFSEILSSLVRHELKRLVNVCSCGDEASQGAGPNVALGFGVKPEEEPSLCPSLVIHVETASLQYNSDDPAALINFALQRLHTNRAGWQSLCEAVTPPPPTSRRRTSSMSVASEEHVEAKEGDGEEGKSEEAAGDDAEGPAWCDAAREFGGAALSYIGAADFLLRVLMDDVVADAVTQGRFGRVERLTTMLKSVIGPIMTEDEEGLCALSSVEQLVQRLEADADNANALRDALMLSAPEEMLEQVGHGYGPTGIMIRSAAQKKRKRAANRHRPVNGALAEILVWAQYSEIPPALRYPEVSPACIYSENEITMEED